VRPRSRAAAAWTGRAQQLCRARRHERLVRPGGALPAVYRVLWRMHMAPAVACPGHDWLVLHFGSAGSATIAVHLWGRVPLLVPCAREDPPLPFPYTR
jgi:hypothetical protein